MLLQGKASNPSPENGSRTEFSSGWKSCNSESVIFPYIFRRSESSTTQRSAETLAGSPFHIHRFHSKPGFERSGSLGSISVPKPWPHLPAAHGPNASVHRGIEFWSMIFGNTYICTYIRTYIRTYSTLHCVALRCIALHYIALHYITEHTCISIYNIS